MIKRKQKFGQKQKNFAENLTFSDKILKNLFSLKHFIKKNDFLLSVAECQKIFFYDLNSLSVFLSLSFFLYFISVLLTLISKSSSFAYFYIFFNLHCIFIPLFMFHITILYVYLMSDTFSTITHSSLFFSFSNFTFN